MTDTSLFVTYKPHEVFWTTSIAALSDVLTIENNSDALDGGIFTATQSTHNEHHDDDDGPLAGKMLVHHL